MEEQKQQEVKCDRCDKVAFTRPVEWKRKPHCKEIVCQECSAHLVTRG